MREVADWKRREVSWILKNQSDIAQTAQRENLVGKVLPASDLSSGEQLVGFSVLFLFDTDR